MKVSGSGDKKVMTVIITKSAGEEKSVATTKNSDKKFILHKSRDFQSSWLHDATSNMWLLCACPIGRRRQTSSTVVIRPLQAHLLLYPHPLSSPISGSFLSLPVQPPLPLHCAYPLSRAVSASLYQLAETPVKSERETEKEPKPIET
ncbi:hypothetical protein P7K49_021092 [Saguinus oedipus]|uniref:Uncharacterized protein n=1 Tax=Saguinus oedipus TaxID=9490 RepID=A0ABQ9USD4_SAGOE|nr:hypothetical protein P7K49_021092 [Saguinus oedipus]